MAKRIQQHILEDESITKFKLLMPSHWIVREKQEDYGIDLEVEVVTTKGIVTGKIFYVQLKATESKDFKQQFIVRLEKERKTYFNNLSYPVALVRYVKPLDKFYLKWINHINDESQVTKKITIHFEESDCLESNKILDIESYIDIFRIIQNRSFEYPLKIFISAKNGLDNTSPIVLETEMLSSLLQFSDLFGLAEEKKALFRILICKEDLIVDSACLSSVKFPLTKSINELGKFAVIGIAMILNSFGDFEKAARLIFSFGLLDFVLVNSVFPEYIVSFLLRSQFLEETLVQLESYEEIPIVQMLKIKAIKDNFNNGNPKRKLVFKNYWITKLRQSEVRNDQRNISICCYNLAGIYKQEENHNLAIAFYQRARKVHSIYNSQPYFFSDVGGLLFRVKKYLVASKMYKVSLDLKHDLRVYALYAEALMYSGHYKDALEAFDHYLKNVEHPESEFVLNSILLKVIVGEYNLSFQVRNSHKADTFFSNESQLELEDKIRLAQESDILNDLAWYNKAANHLMRGEHDSAAIGFIAAGLTCTSDSEAWANASLILINIKSAILNHVIRAAYFFNREVFLTELFSQLNRSISDVNTLRAIKDSIDTVIDDIKNKRPRSIVRLLDGDLEPVDFDELFLN